MKEFKDKLKMDGFLEELKSLLTKHEATILRSAAETNKLVISISTGSDLEEIEFDEEICDSMLEYRWFKKLG